jgi:hypothetical protein
MTTIEPVRELRQGARKRLTDRRTSHSESSGWGTGAAEQWLRGPTLPRRLSTASGMAERGVRQAFQIKNQSKGELAYE